MPCLNILRELGGGHTRNEQRRIRKVVKLWQIEEACDQLVAEGLITKNKYRWAIKKERS